MKLPHMSNSMNKSNKSMRAGNPRPTCEKVEEFFTAAMLILILLLLFFS